MFGVEGWPPIDVKVVVPLELINGPAATVPAPFPATGFSTDPLGELELTAGFVGAGGGGGGSVGLQEIDVQPKLPTKIMLRMHRI